MTDKSLVPSVKLGKLKPKYDKRTLQFSKYLTTAQLPYIPQTSHWPNAAPLGMLLNDTLGDCTIAAALHMERLWSKANNLDYTPSDSDALTAYMAVSGYITGMPSTDGGCYMIDVLNYWRKTGVGGRKIAAYVQINPLNHKHVQAASFLFGGLYVGIDMPISVQQQPSLWDVLPTGLTGSGTPGSWGGHCVSIAGYDQHKLDLTTWGMRINMTWKFWDAYVEECYAVVSNDFILDPNKAPNGISLTELMADLQLVTS